MAEVARQLILGMLLLALAGFTQAAGFRLWAELAPEEQRALAPIAGDWNHFPAQQQEKLLRVAKNYGKLSPRQKELFHRRLQDWTRLTPEQRKIARSNYKKLMELPQSRQVQFKRQWTEARGIQQSDPQAAGPAVSSTP